MPGLDKKQIDRIVKRLGLTKGQRNLLHRELHRESQGRRMPDDEIIERAKGILEDYPNR